MTKSRERRRGTRRARWVVLGAAVVVMVAAAALAGFATARTRSSSTTGLAVGRAAPSWSGTTLDGSALSSGRERGHWVILNFFATWRGPCQHETPQLAGFIASHRARVVGVVYQDSASAARAFVAAHQVTWPLIGDASGSISQPYDAVGLPLVVRDRPGHLVKELFGGVTVASLDALVPQARRPG